VGAGSLFDVSHSATMRGVTLLAFHEAAWDAHMISISGPIWLF
jgi:hypothetical protein